MANVKDGTLDAVKHSFKLNLDTEWDIGFCYRLTNQYNE